MHYRAYTNLPNGQVAMLQALRAFNSHKREEWRVSVVIGDHAKQCRLSVKGDRARKRRGKVLCGTSTGKCGMTGLLVLKDMLLNFISWVDSEDTVRANIICAPYDSRRRSAWRYLLRLPGFKYYTPEDDYVDSQDDYYPEGVYVREQWSGIDPFSTCDE